MIPAPASGHRRRRVPCLAGLAFLDDADLRRGPQILFGDPADGERDHLAVIVAEAIENGQPGVDP